MTVLVGLLVNNRSHGAGRQTERDGQMLKRLGIEAFR